MNLQALLSASFLILFGTFLLAGCSSGDACVSSSDCPMDGQCVDDLCQPAPGADASSDAGSDGSGTDTVVADTSMTMDGATMDTTQADSVGGDAVVDAGPPSYCEESGTWFCEDFEDPAAEAWGREDAMGASIEVDTARSRTGMSSLRTDTRPGGRAVWHTPLPSTIREGTVYVRAWTFLEAGVYDNISMWGVGERRGSFDSISTKVLGNSSGVFDTVASASTTGRALRTDDWQCWILEVGISETEGTISLSVDGSDHLLETGRDTLFGEGFAGIFVGAIFASDTQAPISYWLDTLEVDTSPLACP